MKLVAVVLALSATGCMFFVARDATTQRPVGEHVNRVPINAAPLSVLARAHGATLRVQVSTPRTCRRDLVTEIEVTHGKRLGFEMIGDDSYAVAFALLAAPLTLPISAIIAGAAIGSHKDRITRDQRVTQNGFEPCPIHERGELRIVLPSGDAHVVATSADGRAELTIPDGEPARGIVTVSAGGVAVQVSYDRDAP